VRIAAIAARTVICRGKLWQTCGEPCYRWSRSGYHDSYFRVEFADHTDPHDPETLIRADRLEAWSSVFLPDGMEPEILGHLEVLMPVALRLEPEGSALISCAERFSSPMVRELRDATLDEFRTYAGLRDAMKECNGAVTDDLLTAADAAAAAPRWSERASYMALTHLRRLVGLRLAQDGTQEAPRGMGRA
jgi:hypothetical protein